MVHILKQKQVTVWWKIKGHLWRAKHHLTSTMQLAQGWIYSAFSTYNTSVCNPTVAWYANWKLLINKTSVWGSSVLFQQEKKKIQCVFVITAVVDKERNWSCIQVESLSCSFKARRRTSDIYNAETHRTIEHLISEMVTTDRHRLS